MNISHFYRDFESNNRDYDANGTYSSPIIYKIRDDIQWSDVSMRKGSATVEEIGENQESIQHPLFLPESSSSISPSSPSLPHL